MASQLRIFLSPQSVRASSNLYRRSADDLGVFEHVPDASDLGVEMSAPAALSPRAPYTMSEMLELLHKNPDKLLPEGFAWSDYVVQDVTIGPAVESSRPPHPDEMLVTSTLSPCCNAEIGGVVAENILGLCRNCGCVVMEFNLTRSALRQAVRKAEMIV